MVKIRQERIFTTVVLTFIDHFFTAIISLNSIFEFKHATQARFRHREGHRNLHASTVQGHGARIRWRAGSEVNQYINKVQTAHLLASTDQISEYSAPGSMRTPVSQPPIASRWPRTHTKSPGWSALESTMTWNFTRLHNQNTLFSYKKSKMKMYRTNGGSQAGQSAERAKSP